MEYGYARCSTTIDRQDVNRQKMELKKLGVKESNIFWEYESGAKTDRKELNRLFEVVKQGDTIATTEVSRLTRSTKHLCEIMQMVQEKKLLLNIGGSYKIWTLYIDIRYFILYNGTGSGRNNIDRCHCSRR